VQKLPLDFNAIGARGANSILPSSTIPSQIETYFFTFGVLRFFGAVLRLFLDLIHEDRTETDELGGLRRASEASSQKRQMVS
jgi:hypothetical protein